MAYSQNFPAQRPSFMFDASNAGRLDNRISFSRASTGTFFGTEKVLSSENLLLQSQTLDTTWGATNIATPTGSQTAPDGTSSAWLLTAQTGSSKVPYAGQSPTVSGSTQYTLVGHLKAGTASHGYISFRTQNGHSAYALVDFSGGTVSHAGFGDFTGVTSSVTALGSSWFKVTLTATTGTNLSSPLVTVGISDGTAPTSAGYAVWNTSGETMYAWGAQLNTTGATVYDSPTTTQIARSYQTKLQTAASGAARFEHSASDGQSMGVLIESQTQNLNSYSADFSHGNYSKVNASLESNAALAPDGTLTADLFIEDTTTNNHYLAKAVATGLSVGSTQYAISVYAKAAGRSQMQMYDNGQVTSGNTLFDLANGTVISGGGYIEACGNGWYRCTIIPTVDYGTTGSPSIRLYNGSVTSYQGDGYSGVLLWGLQLETGNGSGTSFSSSYIGTTTTTATRAADSMSTTDANLFDNGEGTIVAEYDTNNPSAVAGIAAITDGTGSSNAVSLRLQASTAKLFVNDAGSTQAATSTTAPSAGVFQKIAGRYAVNDFGVSVNGGSVVSDASGSVPVVSKLEIGTMDNGSYHLNGHVKRVAIYPALSDTNLQAITS